MDLEIGDKIVPKRAHWLGYGYDSYFLKYFEIIKKSEGWYFAKPIFKTEEKKQEFLEYIKNSVSKWMATAIPIFVDVKISYEIGGISFSENDISDFEIIKEVVK